MANPSGHIGYCDTHQKRIYPTRKRAKQHLRDHHPAEKGMREYRCAVVQGNWHVGHLPLAVVEGRKTARQVYRKRAS